MEMQKMSTHIDAKSMRCYLLPPPGNNAPRSCNVLQAYIKGKFVVVVDCRCESKIVFFYIINRSHIVFRTLSYKIYEKTKYRGSLLFAQSTKRLSHHPTTNSL